MRLLNRVDSGQVHFRIGAFTPATIEPRAVAELVLTHADQLPPATATLIRDDPLELDDILHDVAPDARVVQLFDPAAMPTPAQIKARIDRHLQRGAQSAALPDESQALVDALTELRQSLR